MEAEEANPFAEMASPQRWNQTVGATRSESPAYCVSKSALEVPGRGESSESNSGTYRNGQIQKRLRLGKDNFIPEDEINKLTRGPFKQALVEIYHEGIEDLFLVEKNRKSKKM